MSERAEVTVLAFNLLAIEGGDEGGTKLSFVLVRVIKFFYSVMRSIAIITVRAFLMIFNVPTFF